MAFGENCTRPGGRREQVLAGRPPPLSFPLMLSTAAPPDAMQAREGGPLTRPFGLVSDGPRGIRQDACSHVVADVMTRNLVTATEKVVTGSPLAV